MSVAKYASDRSVQIGGLVIGGVLGLMVVLTFAADVPLLTRGFASRSLESATPIAIAAVGGLYAEKSGVFNIGIEGFMILSAILSAVFMFNVGGSDAGQGQILLAMVAATLATTVLAVAFAVLLIRYEADQIVAGLGVWFLGLGFAPFLSRYLWGSVNQFSLPTVGDLPIPGIGISPMVALALVFVVAAWLFLYRTRYGYWIQAAGENPEALDTAGIDVNRVRYAALTFSGMTAAFAGAIVIAHEGSWIGTGQTVIDGRGWIAIVAYLFGNYNPIGAAAAALLFGAMDMISVQFQIANVEFIPGRIINLFPYVGVLIVLTVWGRTRVPLAVGESYESEE